MNKQIRIFIIEEDTVIHHSLHTVTPDANPYTVAVQAIINELTGSNTAKLSSYSNDSPKPMQAQAAMPVTEKPVSLAEMKAMIDKDFSQAKQAPNQAFNVQTIPTIKMSDVLGSK